MNIEKDRNIVGNDGLSDAKKRDLVRRNHVDFCTLLTNELKKLLHEFEEYQKHVELHEEGKLPEDGVLPICALIHCLANRILPLVISHEKFLRHHRWYPLKSKGGSTWGRELPSLPKRLSFD